VVPVADTALPTLAAGELRAVALAPMRAALPPTAPPTLAQPATTRSTDAANHGRHFRQTIAVTGFPH
jgi:hypothetical protein